MAAKAVVLATPAPTTVTLDLDRLTMLPEPTLLTSAAEGEHGLVPRGTTSAGEASICGYYESSKNSRLVCYNGNACIFHASNSDFPGMVGCCPTTSATTPCKIFTTCYDAAEISATAGLLSSTTDPFVMLCTFENSRYCHTRTWPDLNVGDVACTDNSTSWLETMYTAGSLTDVSDEADQVTETISVSWIADAALLSLRSVSATTTAATTSSTIEASETATPSDKAESDDSSTPVGTIAGAVVGSVLGLLLIVAAVFFWRRKNKGERAEQPTYKHELASHEYVPELPSNHTAQRHELPTEGVRYELE